MSESKGSFRSNFGFLMSAVGVAIGLGNIWGFPYKMGANGGAVFLIIYLVMAVVIGYPLLVGELALGRKTRKAAVEAYRAADPRFAFNGVFETLVPFLLLCFYCVLGGIVLRYLIANIGDMFGASWGVHGMGSEEFFNKFVTNVPLSFLFTAIFLGLTSYVVFRGIEGGIERFCSVGMPLLFVMLIITVIRCCTLPHASAGLEFIFKPDFSVLAHGGWFKVVATAASQLFFSISLGSGALIAYGSYMRKEDNLEQNSFIIPVMDTIAALLAAMAVFPAVFSEGIAPSGGPGLLFVSLQTVFESMKGFGALFGSIFYALVFVASFSSSIGMMEGGISALMDYRAKRGKSINRPGVTLFITCTTLIGSTLVCFDHLGGNPDFWKPFGLDSWLNVFDLAGEGVLMPLGGLIMAILLGWVRRGYLDDEVRASSAYKSKPFVDFCWRYAGPVIMAVVVFVQFSSFVFSNTGWYQALMG